MSAGHTKKRWNDGTDKVLVSLCRSTNHSRHRTYDGTNVHINATSVLQSRIQQWA